MDAPPGAEPSRPGAPLGAALPAALLEVIADALPAAARKRVVEGFAAARPGALRANLLRTTAEGLAAELAAAGIAATPHPLSPAAFTVARADERVIRTTAAFREGRLYQQSLASQAAVWVAPPAAGARALDACAAPGGKTTHLAMMVGARGSVVACERAAVRFEKLRHNLRVQGASNVRAHCCDARFPPQRLVDGGFDHALVDPPCSGSGTIRADDPRTWAHLVDDYAGYVELKARQQGQILGRCAALVRPGGTLVYATCSIDPREDEAQVDDLLAAGAPFDLLDLAPWARCFAHAGPGLAEFRGRRYRGELARALRIWPDADTEGFFVAALRRR